VLQINQFYKLSLDLTFEVSFFFHRNEIIIDFRFFVRFRAKLEFVKMAFTRAFYPVNVVVLSYIK
jgi:hypothetical protein